MVVVWSETNTKTKKIKPCGSFGDNNNVNVCAKGAPSLSMFQIGEPPARDALFSCLVGHSEAFPAFSHEECCAFR